MKETPALVTEEFPLDGGPGWIQERLQEDLAQVGERLRALVAPPHRKVEPPVMYAVEHTGRLLRPSLVLLSSYLVEAEPDVPTRRRVIDSAAVVEILHLATLYHDDLIDDAELRRGRPTAKVKYGDALALLTGDYLLARCMRIATSLGLNLCLHLSLIF